MSYLFALGFSFASVLSALSALRPIHAKKFTEIDATDFLFEVAELQVSIHKLLVLGCEQLLRDSYDFVHFSTIIRDHHSLTNSSVSDLVVLRHGLVPSVHEPLTVRCGSCQAGEGRAFV